MNIEKNSVVKFHYSVTETGKEQLESSKEGEPLSVLIGHGGIIPGLEEALIGKQAGDQVAVTISPEQAYGERHEGMTQRIAGRQRLRRRIAGRPQRASGLIRSRAMKKIADLQRADAARRCDPGRPANSGRAPKWRKWA